MRAAILILLLSVVGTLVRSEEPEVPADNPEETNADEAERELDKRYVNRGNRYGNVGDHGSVDDGQDDEVSPDLAYRTTGYHNPAHLEARARELEERYNQRLYSRAAGMRLNVEPAPQPQSRAAQQYSTTEYLQLEIDRHAQEIQILMRHIKNMNARITQIGPGPTGPLGPPGHPGSKGDRGYDGLPGLPGEKGDRGFEGAKGDLGMRGPQGIQGTRGMQGYPGPVGEKGNPGIDGNKGDRGFIGPMGPRGDPGMKGDKGLRGLPGPSGKDGELGPPGYPGKKGEPGRDGPPGRHGNPGQKGEAGVAGIPGQAGPRGEAGVPGPSGPQGNTGLQGIQGPQGEKGDRGHQGVPGEAGIPGETGKDGIPGLPGWLNDSSGYCILSLGNCPPGFTEIQAYTALIDHYKFGDYSLIKQRTHPDEASFAMRINACCR